MKAWRSAEVPAFGHEAFAHLHDVGVIDAEHMNCRSSFDGSTKKPSSLPLEVIRPRVSPGMKEGCDFTGHGIDSGHIRPLPSIAAQTGQSQIRLVGGAVVLLCDDVV